jgi:hypothetical protein
MPVGQSIEQESAICLQSVMDAFTDALLSQERFFSPVGRRQAAKQARPDFRRRRGQRGSQGRQNGRGKRSGVKASLLAILRDAGSAPSLPWERGTRAARQ